MQERNIQTSRGLLIGGSLTPIVSYLFFNLLDNNGQKGFERRQSKVLESLCGGRNCYHLKRCTRTYFDLIKQLGSQLVFTVTSS